MKKIYKTLLFIAFPFSVISVLSGSLNTSKALGDDGFQTYAIDFSKKTGEKVQYLKKFDSHNPIWYFKGNMDETLNHESTSAMKVLEGLNHESMRTDVFFGYYGAGDRIANSPTSNGSDPNNYIFIKELSEWMHKYNIEPYYLLNGIPEYAQKNGYMGAPDFDKYYEAIYNFAKYLGDNNLASNFETWNEPDLGNWNSDFYSMMKTSALATKAIHQANPNSTVSALGLAFASKWLDKEETVKIDGENSKMSHWNRFLEQCEEVGDYPDAFAWHYYGSVDGDVSTNYDEKDNVLFQAEYLDNLIKASQTEHPQLKKMTQHLTEYHPVSTSGSIEDTTQNVQAYFDCVEPLLNITDASRAFWPMFLMDQFGVVDKFSHTLNLTYNFLWVYGRLPLDRITDATLPENVGQFIAKDSKRAGVVVYNKGLEKEEFNLKLSNLDLKVATTDVYKLSTKHINYNQSIEHPFHVLHKTGLKDTVTIKLDANEAYYIELNTAENMSELDVHPTSAKLLKKEFYYEDRGVKKPYGSITKDSLIAITSMAGNDSGLATVSARLKTLDPKLQIKYETWGTFNKSSDSAFAIRVDFHKDDGTYQNSIYYTLKDMDKEVVLPFGTEKAASEKIALNGSNLELALADKAPANWDGEIALTFIMKDAGEDATAKFTIL